MASINSNEKSPGDPPDKKLAEADAEKQPLSGVSINKQYKRISKAIDRTESSEDRNY